ncbi:DUF4880 domain-containing protein [Asaia sp. VD9]|uniref:FecR family protein n=1 Tax=Asaia sp. VD9 TaxID=3081235 RepID=UPI003017C331
MTPDHVEQAADWQARLLSDRCSDQDRARFHAWLRESEAHHKAYDLVSQIWQSGSFAPAQRAAPHSRRAVLGAFALCAAGTVAAPQTADAQSIRTGRNQTRHVVMGAVTVQMDACSALTCGPERHKLDFGQGRFAFSLRPDQAALRFGCCAWRISGERGDYALDVTPDRMILAVISGGLNLHHVHAAAARLGPGQLMVFDRRTLQARVTEGRVDDLLAWREGRAIFHETPLDQAVAEMARYSDRSVVLLSPSLAHLRLSGVFHTRDPKRFFNALAHLLPLRVLIERDRIAIVKL